MDQTPPGKIQGRQRIKLIKNLSLFVFPKEALNNHIHRAECE